MGQRTSKNTDRTSLVVSESLDETTSFPYDLDKTGHGLSVINNDTANTLRFSVLTRKNELIGPISVPPRASLNELYPEFRRIVLNTASASFDMLVKVSSDYY